MRLAGSAVIGVQRDRVWAALQDPAVLVRTIPGCERLEATGPDTYKMTVNAGVASLKGVYQGEVALADPLAPESFTIKARGQGAPGTVDATVLIRLSEVDGGTRVDYDADAVVGGTIGGVGQRMLGSAAKRTAGQFFAAVEEHLRAPVAAAVAPEQPAGVAVTGVGVTTEAGATTPAEAAVYQRPPKERTETRPWVLLASFGMGAGITLTSVVIGWLLGRASRARRP
ncbi:carbon monoxide dehydrogenase subunit G [Nonomuraea sp. K274]|uniref:Carbon monoxide dehydrogenase subunit G n=1 Tax=Nonomuraea cypriaca TaxID=1187855 RepID=A0A931F0W0_9ACTN|nr:carbon monoxide dehydrogenase subunit G [Nonomuraea cypriaca]MBF8187551.1 carbon monoxide dehydrogenase subunit G [Nonomuraea cypriaca]